MTRYRVGANRDKIARLRMTHPGWTLARIGEEVGVTKERVRQLLKKQGLPTKSIRHSRLGRTT